MKYLIVNADDFGLTNGVCDGILAGIAQGGISSTSAMTCRPDAVARLRRHVAPLAGRCGVHLQLTGGAPLLPAERVPSLAGPGGTFPRNRAGLHAPVLGEIEREWRAQVDAVIAAGIQPTHIDTHQHVHKDPAVFAAYLRIAQAYGLPARSCSPDMTNRLRAAGVACPGAFECSWSGSALPAGALLESLDRIFAGGARVVEVMCHPGYADAPLAACSTLVDSRETDLAALCDPAFAAGLSARGIVLASMTILARRDVAWND